MVLSKSINIPILTVFLIGVLGSTAPCQITTNLGAIGYISKEGVDRKKLAGCTFWFTAGKIVVYLIYGILITIFSIEIQKTSIPLFEFVRKFIGIFVILIGLNILGVIKFGVSLGSSLACRSEELVNKYQFLHPSFMMGILFSLAFCPTLFWLFFGLVVPLSIKSTFGILFPVVFALGTLLPLGVILLLYGFHRETFSNKLKVLKKNQKVLRTAGGIILVLLGIIDSLIYWFG